MLSIHLRAARLRLGWSLEELATETGEITKQMLSKYEQGASLPSRPVFLRLCQALRVPAESLLTTQVSDVQFVAFRKNADLPVSEQDRIKAEVFWCIQRRRDFMRMIGEEVPSARLPRYEAKHVQEAEAHAAELRLQWGLGSGPLPNLTNLLEDKGFEVIVVKAHERFSGISAWADNGRVPVVVVQARPQDGARQRMDASHEVAHLVGSPSNQDDEEDYAKRFAGAFLLPALDARREFGSPKRNRITLAELKAIKIKYGISIQGILRRARDLEIINQTSYDWWHAILGKQGKRKDEGEPYVSTERPTKPARLASRAVVEGLISTDQLRGYGELGPEEIADLQGQTPVRYDTPQRRLLRMTKEERDTAWAEESKQLAEHYRKHPDEVLPDFYDEDPD